MKKFIAILVTAAMLVSMIIVSTVSVSAVVGDWSVFADSGSIREDATEKKDFPGYEYNDEGLHIIPAEWKQTGPWAVAQTTNPVNLRDGVYLEARVDNFTYYAGDKWFSFGIHELRNDQIPEDKSNMGGQFLNRIKGKDTDGDGKADKFDALSATECWHHVVEGPSIRLPSIMGDIRVDEEGRPILTLEIMYDAANESYSFYVNGAAAPDAYNIALTQYFEERGGEAYISFYAQNSEKGGTVEFTVLKFGTSKETAETPVGDDSAEPVDNSIEYAEIIDPSTVEAGEPAIKLNGSPEESDVSRKPSSYLSNIIEIQDDYAARIYASADGDLSASYKVNPDVSYDCKDFPIMAVIARNLCTCADKAACALTESFTVLTLAGDIVQETSSASTTISSASWEPDYVGEDSYMLLCGSWEGFEGRINGFRIDHYNMQVAEGRNFFDICEVLFFRTEDEAQAYYAAYLAELTGGEVTPPEDETTEAPADETTEAPAVDTEEPTDAPTEAPTQAPVVEDPTEAPTQAPVVEDPTEAPKTEDPTDAPEEPKKGGCGSVVGIGAIAVVAFAAAGLVSFKKKED